MIAIGLFVFYCFCVNDTATTEIYTLSLHDALPILMLERIGYRADVAADGLEALEALSRVPYAAVLMDIHMPEMDGYQATKEIRRREGSERHTPIIAMTANALEGDREKALEAGMDDYVPKPVKPEELETVLQRWILEKGDSASDTEGSNGFVAAAEGTEGRLD